MSNSTSPTPLSGEDRAPMTADELEEIESRAYKATPGPWVDDPDIRPTIKVYRIGMKDPGGEWSHEYLNSKDKLVQVGYIARIPKHDKAMFDSEFIANARTDVPKLVNEVRRLTKENESLRGRLDKEVVAEEGRKVLWHYPLEGHEASEAGYRLMLQNKAVHQAFRTLFARLGLTL